MDVMAMVWYLCAGEVLCWRVVVAPCGSEHVAAACGKGSG